MILPQFILIIGFVLAEEEPSYDVIDDQWAAPQEGCRPATEGGSISVDCFISGTQFSYKVDRAATTVTVEYVKLSPLICTDLIQAKPLVESYTSANGQTVAHVKVFAIKFIVLSDESLVCPLTLLGTNTTNVLKINQSRGQLMPYHVKGLQGVRKLQILNIENNITSVPYAVMVQLSSLEIAILTGGSFIIKEEGDESFLPNLKTLELSQGGLKMLPKRAFKNTPGLTLLLLFKNQIEFVDVDAFEDLTNLEQLSLVGNRITTLPIGVFRFNTNLMNIDMYNNEFTNLTEGVFRGLTKLRKILLMYNRVNLTLYGGVFSQLPSLSHLNLNSASLTNAPPDLMTNSPLLQSINMANNFLVTLPPNLFSAIANSAGQKSAIISIDLSNNQLNYINEEQFTNLTSLKTLNLKNNLVTNLSVGVFSDLSNLETLNLKNNKIEILETLLFKGLSNLYNLDLDENRIKTIKPGVFDVLRSLQVLSLSNNNLTISETMNTDERIDMNSYATFERSSEPHKTYLSRFHSLVGLTNLSLSGNQVSIVCDDWLEEMFQLRHLNLSNNNFTGLSVHDTYFSYNVLVDFSNNKIENVDLFAFEASLPIESRPTLRLMGNPFKCTCDLYPFLSMSPNNAPRVELGDATCSAPSALQGTKVAALGLDKLICPEQCSPCDCLLRPALRRLEITCAALPNLTALDSLDKYKRLLRITNSTIMNEVVKNLPPAVQLDIDLSNLNLTIPPVSPFKRTAPLTMDLRNNTLNTVPIGLLHAGVKIYLENNSLECTCEHSDDLQAAFPHKDAIIDYSEIKCLGGRGLDEAVRAAASGELCARRVATLAISSVIASLLLTLAVTAYLYKRKTRIQILCRKYFPKLASDLVAYRYDIFVSYEYSDERFVLSKILPELEGKYSLRLCVHSRDWTPGENISQLSERSVSDSALTLALVSPSYLESAWCLQELLLAHSRATLLLLVLDKDALETPLAAQGPAQSLVREYIRSNTYVSASNSRSWNKVRDAVFKRRALPSAVTISIEKDKPRGLDTQLTNDGKIVNAVLTRV